jgi:hypothetical protein
MRALAILALALAGCTTVEPEVRRPDARIVHIKIASAPLGSAVFFNGEYMGLTPLTMPVEADADGNWKHPVRIQCQVPHDPFNQDTYRSPAGFAVPKHLLFRVPKYMTWYRANQKYPPSTL